MEKTEKLCKNCRDYLKTCQPDELGGCPKYTPLLRKPESQCKCDEPKPDKSRLTLNDALKLYDKEGIMGVVDAVKKMKDAECQVRVERMFKEIEAWLPNAIEDKVWQFLKKRNGVK